MTTKIFHINLGLSVFCDDCGDDYTDRPDEGGILFQNKACCPACAPRMEALAKKYNETHFIRARCPEGMSFSDWVRVVLR